MFCGSRLFFFSGRGGKMALLIVKVADPCPRRSRCLSCLSDDIDLKLCCLHLSLVTLMGIGQTPPSGRLGPQFHPFCPRPGPPTCPTSRPAPAALGC